MSQVAEVELCNLVHSRIELHYSEVVLRHQTADTDHNWKGQTARVEFKMTSTGSHLGAIKIHHSAGNIINMSLLFVLIETPVIKLYPLHKQVYMLDLQLCPACNAFYTGRETT